MKGYKRYIPHRVVVKVSQPTICNFWPWCLACVDTQQILFSFLLPLILRNFCYSQRNNRLLGNSPLSHSQEYGPGNCAAEPVCSQVPSHVPFLDIGGHSRPQVWSHYLLSRSCLTSIHFPVLPKPFHSGTWPPFYSLCVSGAQDLLLLLDVVTCFRPFPPTFYSKLFSSMMASVVNPAHCALSLE